LPGTNTLAYLASLSATKTKSFITLTSDRHWILVDADCHDLQCLVISGSYYW
jgi:hypothetical protein